MKNKTLGLIGGIGPESTVDYYQRLISGFYSKTGKTAYPNLIINSIDLNRMKAIIDARQYDKLVDSLLKEITRLKNAGADFAALTANTPHLVFDQLEEVSPLPLVSIVKVTIREIKKRNIKKAALLGTRFTMSGGFYQKEAEKSGIQLIIPTSEQQDYIHEKYFSELVVGQFKEETRCQFIEIVEAMNQKEPFEGLILGGTEIPLLIKPTDIPDKVLFDTTEIHVQALLQLMLE